MSEQIRLKITDLIGSKICISGEDGQKVFEKAEKLLRDGKCILISFDNVEMLISLFLNVAIGQLYGVFPEEVIRNQVKVEGLVDDDMELLKRVVDNAKKYYANKKDYDQAWSEENDE